MGCETVKSLESARCHLEKAKGEIDPSRVEMASMSCEQIRGGLSQLRDIMQTPERETEEALFEQQLKDVALTVEDERNLHILVTDQNFQACRDLAWRVLERQERGLRPHQLEMESEQKEEMEPEIVDGEQKETEPEIAEEEPMETEPQIADEEPMETEPQIADEEQETEPEIVESDLEQQEMEPENENEVVQQVLPVLPTPKMKAKKAENPIKATDKSTKAKGKGKGSNEKGGGKGKSKKGGGKGKSKKGGGKGKSKNVKKAKGKKGDGKAAAKAQPKKRKADGAVENLGDMGDKELRKKFHSVIRLRLSLHP